MAYSIGNRQVGWGALSARNDGGKEPATWVNRAGRYWGAENGNCNFFCPRRAAKDREGPRRTATATSGTATATPFVHGGHRGPRRTATATSFVHEGPLRATKGREELQRQLQERQPQHLLSTEDAEGQLERQLQLLLSTKGREGPRRATKNCNGNFRNSNCNTFCPRRATKGREGPRRTAAATSGTATETPFVH